MTEDGEPAQLEMAELSPAKLDELFCDIAALGQDPVVTLKHGATEHVASAAPVSLEQAKQALLERTIVGAQIRYRHNGIEWIDTLIRVHSAIRLVRARGD